MEPLSKVVLEGRGLAGEQACPSKEVLGLDSTLPGSTPSVCWTACCEPSSLLGPGGYTAATRGQHALSSWGWYWEGEGKEERPTSGSEECHQRPGVRESSRGLDIWAEAGRFRNYFCRTWDMCFRQREPPGGGPKIHVLWKLEGASCGPSVKS